MRGRFRRKTRAEAQQEPTFHQEDFSGGLNSDVPASKIRANEVYVNENFVVFEDGRIEGRSGTQLFSNTVLPGSGTIHAMDQHPTSKKFVLYRGQVLYYADSAMAAWTELKTNGMNYNSATFTGAVTVTLIDGYFKKTTASNSNAGVLYWNLVSSGGDRTLNVYKDVAKSNLVASGTRAGTGVINCQQQNNSGILIGANLSVYSSDDTDSGNTITGLTASSFDINQDGRFVKYKNDFILLLTRNTDDSTTLTLTDITSSLYIDMTALVFYYLGAGQANAYGAAPLVNSGSEGSSTPYGRRYIYTWSRIVNYSDAEDVTLNRTTGKLVFESPTNRLYSATQADYGETWLASAIGSNAISLIAAGETVHASKRADNRYTHTSLYASLDIGVNGIDPVTGAGNNREIYVWVADIDITAVTYTDTTTDAILRARLLAGFGLRTRFWVEQPSGSLGDIISDFLYKGKQATNKITYGQLAKPEYLGFYNPALQTMTVEDSLQDIRKSGTSAVVLCNKSTYVSNPKVFENASNLESVFVLRGPTKVPGNIGVIDYGSIAEKDENSLIAHCSDHTVRIFDGQAWGADLAGNRISRIIETIVEPGSVGVFEAGVYLLWYKNATGDTIPTQCLRLGFGGKAGLGWSKCTGADFPFPPLYLGALTITDANNIQRILVYDSADDLFHWVETFTSRSLTKYYKDKVAVAGTGGTSVVPKFRPRELIGPTESYELYHEESHIYPRAQGSAFVSGMTLTARAYVDGGSTATGSISSASTSGGDLQFFERVRGNRIQMEYEFSESGQIVTSIDTHYQAHDVAAIEDGPGESLEAGYQLEIASSLLVWITRPRAFNRATAAGLTLTGTAPTLVTGPDGNTYAMSFTAAYSYVTASIAAFTDFSFCFWIKSFTTGVNQLFVFSATMEVLFTNNTTINICGQTLTVDTIASGWHNFWLSRSGSTISVYQNGALKGTVTFGTAGTAAAFRIGDSSNFSAVILDDIRFRSATITAAAVSYYYTQVVAGGNKVLPPV